MHGDYGLHLGSATASMVRLTLGPATCYRYGETAMRNSLASQVASLPGMRLFMEKNS